MPCKCSSYCTGNGECLEAIADGGEQLHGAAGGALRASSSHAGAPPALSQELGMPLVYEGLATHQVVLAQHHVALREKTGLSGEDWVRLSSKREQMSSSHNVPIQVRRQAGN